jgi:hypothetical protein
VIEDWLAALDPALRGRMRAKIQVLITTDGDLPPKMLTDTKEPHIKELIVNSKEALRLLLCRVRPPGSNDQEITLLYGAKERDRKYVPHDALQVAEQNRQMVLRNSKVHRRLRKNVHC